MIGLAGLQRGLYGPLNSDIPPPSVAPWLKWGSRVPRSQVPKPVWACSMWLRTGFAERGITSQFGYGRSFRLLRIVAG